MSNLKPIIRRPKAAEDVEGHAMYIADGSIDAATKFLERAEQTTKRIVIVSSQRRAFSESSSRTRWGANKIGEGLPESRRVLHRARPYNRDNSSSTRWSRHEHRITEKLATANGGFCLRRPKRSEKTWGTVLSPLRSKSGGGNTARNRSQRQRVSGRRNSA